MSTQPLETPEPGLVHIPGAGLSQPLDFYLDLGRAAMRESKAKRTRDAYASDWKVFCSWCERHHETALPASPPTVVAYLSAMADRGCKASSMGRHLVSIGTAHKAANLETPTSSAAVRAAIQGFKRLLGTAKTKKTALKKADLVRVFAEDDDPGHAVNVRDRAILLLGFSGAFRRSELAALHVENVRFTEEGMIVRLVRSKTDQFGEGRDVAILRGGQLCPVRALQQWITLATIAAGPLFRRVHWRGAIDPQRGLSGEAIALIVKRRIESIGKKPKEYGGHSLRRGFCTAAARAGATELQIMRISGHKSSAMVQEYIEQAGLFENNASGLLGL